MIELTPLARPYAKALFASALEVNNIDEMALELKTMASASMTCLLYTSPSPRDS